MKLIIRISVACLILLVLIFIFFRDPQQDNTTKHTDKMPQRSTSRDKDEPKDENESTVKLFNLVSPPFTQVKEFTLTELAEKYQFPIEFRDNKSKYIIHSDDAGNVIKIAKHEGHYQSVSKKNDAQIELEKSGYYITQLGSNFFNLKNRDGMYAIIDALRSAPLDDFKFKENYDDKTEVEIIPVKILLKNPAIDLPINVEMDGILINRKQDYIFKEWQTDTKFRSIKLSDYIASYWNLLPVHLGEHPVRDPKYSSYIVNTSKQIGLFLPELRVNQK